MISQLFCLKGKIQKEHFNDHPRQASTAGSHNDLFCFLPQSKLLFEILAPGIMIISYQKSSCQSCHEKKIGTNLSHIITAKISESDITLFLL